MPVWIVRTLLLAALPCAAAQSPSTSITQPGGPTIVGAWALNPALTQKPAEIGFTPDWARAAGEGGDGGRYGGRGRRGRNSGGGDAGVPQVPAETADDSTRVQQLTAEARTPALHLTIVQHDSSVDIADDQGLARTFHPNGQLESLSIGTVALPTTAQWNQGSLVVVYNVESGRQIRYTYTPQASPARLLVEIRFIDRGKEGDDVRLTYEPPDAHNAAILSGTPESSVASAPAAPTGTTPAPSGTNAPAAAGRPSMLPPGSELRGINTIAIDVDDLSAEATACGLDQTRIKNAISKVLTNAGMKVLTYGKEDADVVVNIATSKLPQGGCVSRYDTSLVSYADATFPYVHGTVAAVEVQLLHEGGLAGGAPAPHANDIMNAVTKSVTHFVAQIRAAGK